MLKMKKVWNRLGWFLFTPFILLFVIQIMIFVIGCTIHLGVYIVFDKIFHLIQRDKDLVHE